MDDSPNPGASPVLGAPPAPADPLPTPSAAEHPSAPLPAVDGDWCWPPYAPPPPADTPRFDIDEWAPSSVVRRPLVRLGRWTLLYRRGL
ncbi:hypothetical protein [Klenkia sp. PcliD-1-E]|uniref:hypothetical protein n=1 Tax=Klenkia sp. PcliD-1-E TaxID=2954492 RepID=UPI002098044E|nr:hypothetical protein [Klenkia sp. PcliD-1-E]MCO7220665.1 hypothetical protein [Klenkia sp. PcliD-1-E]